MRLLNLWPQEEVVANPKKRLLLEAVLALLCVVALLLTVWLWLNWRMINATDTNKLLKSELARLTQTRTVEISSGAQMPRVMRQLLVGQLDWMGELPQWMMDDRIRWTAARLDESGLTLEGVASNSSAINEMLDKIRARYPRPPSKIHEISNVRVGEQNLWHFEVKMNLETLQNKVELSSSVEPPSDVAPANPATVPATAAPTGGKP